MVRKASLEPGSYKSEEEEFRPLGRLTGWDFGFSKGIMEDKVETNGNYYLGFRVYVG